MICMLNIYVGGVTGQFMILEPHGLPRLSNSTWMQHRHCEVKVCLDRLGQGKIPAASLVVMIGGSLIAVWTSVKTNT